MEMSHIQATQLKSSVEDWEKQEKSTEPMADLRAMLLERAKKRTEKQRAAWAKLEKESQMLKEELLREEMQRMKQKYEHRRHEWAQEEFQFLRSLPARSTIIHLGSPTTKRKEGGRNKNTKSILFLAPLASSTSFSQYLNKSVLKVVRKKAKPLHRASYAKLLPRVQRLGYGQMDLDRAMQYVSKEAPMVIHVKETTLKHLIDDTHIRNSFEVNSKSNRYDTWRRNRENKLFNGKYEGRHDSLRPKYGALNLFGDVRGCSWARDYGDVYITLADHVRPRITFGDHGTEMTTTGKYCAHLLEAFNDSDLRRILSVAASPLNRAKGRSSDKAELFCEFQAHGFIDLSTDIEALTLPGSEHEASDELKSVVGKFQKKTCCNVLWQDDLLE